MVAVAATLGLGSGAAATIFAVRSAVLGAPLAYDPDDRLVLVWNRLSEAGYGRLPLSDAEWLDHRRALLRSGVAERAAAFLLDGVTLLGAGQPRALTVVRAEPELLGMLTVDWSVHGFEGDRVCVVSHRAWLEYFGSNPDLVGDSIDIDGSRHEVLGILPPEAAFPPPITWQARTTGDGLGADIFLPLSAEHKRPRGDRRLMAVARLNEKSHLGIAKRKLEESALKLAESYPREHPPGLSTTTVSLRQQSVELARPILRTLTLAVGLLLVVSCVNVSLLLLARSVERRGEVAIRAALGARRRHLVTAALAESFGLAASGGLVALVSAAWACAVIRRWELPGLPSLADVRLDAGVAWSCLALAGFCGIVTGLAPAWRIFRGELSRDLKAARTSAGAGRLGLTQASLVVVELAMAVMLLAISSVLVKDFVDLSKTDPGFRTAGISLLDVRLGSSAEDDVLDRLLVALQDLPEADQAAAAMSPPLSAGLEASAFHLDLGGTIVSSGSELAVIHRVTSDYLRVLEIPITAGADRPGDGVIVSADLARRMATDPQAVIGARLTLEDPRDPDATWFPIRGLAGGPASVRARDSAAADAGARTDIYLALGESAEPDRISLLVSGRAAVPLPARELREAIWRVDPSLPVSAEDLSSRLDDARSQPRVAATLLVSFAGLASFLATVGVHGVLAFQVARRGREVALRQALGATLSDIRQQVVGQSIRWAALGAGAGLLLSWICGRLLRSLLPGFRFDTSHLAPLLLAAVLVLPLAWLAAWLPARRAAQVDLVAGLRADG